MRKSAEPSQLTATAWTALGFIAMQPRTGYDIKQATGHIVDTFWGVSYAQLYPQLRNLQALGLIEAEPVTGPRGQTVWRITDEGRRVLFRWLGDPPAPPQLRDEALLKVLLAEAISPEDLLPLIAAKRREFEGWLALNGDTSAVSSLLREYAVGQARAGLAWCDAAEKRITGT
jgi:DNA-binding PadR family transcriptional regulator